MKNLSFYFLSRYFYTDYAGCSEIEKKFDRPYAVVLIEYEDLTFAIPLRSHISHKYAFFTNKEKTKGLDYSKAVPILKDKYIELQAQKYPSTISQSERQMLYNKTKEVEKGLIDYIDKYRNAIKKRHIYANQQLCKFSCLKYFHTELEIDETPII